MTLAVFGFPAMMAELIPGDLGHDTRNGIIAPRLGGGLGRGSDCVRYGRETPKNTRRNIFCSPREGELNPPLAALSALAGAAIGGMTSFATSWFTQQAQLRTRGAKLKGPSWRRSTTISSLRSSRWSAWCQTRVSISMFRSHPPPFAPVPLGAEP
jgi:hypothetical protein